MKKLNLGSKTRYDTVGIIEELRKLDKALVAPRNITLCGSASVLLQTTNFRETLDIDFCLCPDEDVLRVIHTIWENKLLFDVHASGVIGLLIDFEDRLVQVPLGFKFLNVYCLSKRDWIVSKLASPKLEDVLDRQDITVEDLLWVADRMHEYGGTGVDRAISDLNYLTRVLRERECCQ